jgi:hypothetical protein
MSEIIKAIKRFLIDHEVEDAAKLLCNLLLELLEATDEDFAMEVVSAVMGNERFDLDCEED